MEKANRWKGKSIGMPKKGTTTLQSCTTNPFPHLLEKGGFDLSLRKWAELVSLRTKE